MGAEQDTASPLRDQALEEVEARDVDLVARNPVREEQHPVNVAGRVGEAVAADLAQLGSVEDTAEIVADVLRARRLVTKK